MKAEDICILSFESEVSFSAKYKTMFVGTINREFIRAAYYVATMQREYEGKSQNRFMSWIFGLVILALIVLAIFTLVPTLMNPQNNAGNPTPGISSAGNTNKPAPGIPNTGGSATSTASTSPLFSVITPRSAIATIIHNPAAYRNKRVALEGKITLAFGQRMFTLDETGIPGSYGTGKILVITPKNTAVPENSLASVVGVVVHTTVDEVERESGSTLAPQVRALIEKSPILVADTIVLH